MDPKALAAAKVRLERAKNAVTALDTAITLADMHSAWSAFLLAAGGIYSKLQRGAKGDSKSVAWFGGITHVRKTDPLLSYIHQARNSEEHSVYAPPNRLSRPQADRNRRTVALPAFLDEPASQRSRRRCRQRRPLRRRRQLQTHPRLAEGSFALLPDRDPPSLHHPISAQSNLLTDDYRHRPVRRSATDGASMR
jgi:hypothetical protein